MTSTIISSQRMISYFPPGVLLFNTASVPLMSSGFFSITEVAKSAEQAATVANTAAQLTKAGNDKINELGAAAGVLVAEDYTQSDQALETTHRLLEHPPEVIFEAALEYGGVFVRPDALVRVGEDLWDLFNQSRH